MNGTNIKTRLGELLTRLNDYRNTEPHDELVKFIISEVSRVLSELEELRNREIDANIELHGRRDCKSCSLVEGLEVFIEAKRKEYE